MHTPQGRTQASLALPVPDSRTTPAHPGARRGVLTQLVQGLSRALAWLVLSLILSIVLEWVGMVYWWQDQGITHSADMLDYEIALVASELEHSLVSGDPAGFVEDARDRAQRFLEITGIAGLTRWAAAKPEPVSRTYLARAHRIAHRLSHFLIAAVQVVQLFTVRLAILVLALPAFVLLGGVGLVDGLVARDLRRRGGGRESSFIYHHARAAIAPLLVAPWVVYLALPVSLHPGWIVLPAAALAGLAMALSARSFKKYL